MKKSGGWGDWAGKTVWKEAEGLRRNQLWGKKGCLGKVRLQVVRQVVGVDKSVMEGGKRTTVKIQKSVC
jgi:hypothetical protein